MKRNKGFTLIELIIVIAILGILTAIIVPAVKPNIEMAKESVAKKSAQGYAMTVAEFLIRHWEDLQPGLNPPDPPIVFQAPVLKLLHTEGNPPALDTTVANVELWKTDGSGFDLSQIDTIRNQLITNTPGGSAANAYSTTGPNSWIGPYLFETGSDPWGNHYLCILNTGPGNFMGVISAGPDGMISTNPTQLATNFEVGKDDIFVPIN